MPQVTITDAISFIGTVAAIIIALSTRRKSNAEAADLESQITERLLKQTQSTWDHMQKQIDDVRAENKRLRTYIQRLCDQVVSLGGVPIPMPDEEK